MCVQQLGSLTNAPGITPGGFEGGTIDPANALRMPLLRAAVSLCQHQVPRI